MLFNVSPWSHYSLLKNQDTEYHKESQWTYYCDNRFISKNDVPTFSKLENGRAYAISTELTYDGTKDNSPYVFFYTHHLFTQVYLDDELLFSYTNNDVQKLDGSKSPGSIYATVPLPKDCIGKTFTIVFYPSLDTSIEYELPHVFFGDYPYVIRKIFLSSLPHNIIALVAMFLGIATILFTTFTLTGQIYREGIVIGIFAIIFGIYNMMQCMFNVIIIQNPYFIYLLNYLSLSLIAIFMLAYLREKFSQKRQYVANALLIFVIVVTVLQFSLHFNGIIDLKEFLPIAHTIYLICIMMCFFMIVTMKNSDIKKQLVLQYTPVAIGMLIDLVLFHLHLTFSSVAVALFSTLGVIAFLVIEIKFVWHNSIRIYTASIRSNKYREMAYIDKLTGIGNRRAFDTEKIRITSGEMVYDNLVVISADVNNLKLVNDTLGHSAGDYLIKLAAEVLNAMSDNYGNIFRTGGDEFLGFLYDISPEEFNQKIDKAKAQIKELNARNDVHLSIALGYEFVEDNNIEEAIENADQKMYIDKKLTKAKN